jgi:hypothetical protein
VAQIRPVAVEVDTGGSSAAVGSVPVPPWFAELAGWDTAAVAGTLGEDVEDDAAVRGLSAREYLRLEWGAAAFLEVAQNQGRCLD